MKRVKIISLKNSFDVTGTNYHTYIKTYMSKEFNVIGETENVVIVQCFKSQRPFNKKDVKFINEAK